MYDSINLSAVSSFLPLHLHVLPPLADGAGMALVVSPGLVARVWIEELEQRAEHNLSLHEALSGGQLGKKGVQERDALSE